MAAVNQSRGRTARIYTFLRGCKHPQNTRTIAAATDDQARTQITSVTLANMVQAGYLVRSGEGWGNTCYAPTSKLPKGLHAATMPAPVDTPKPAAPAKPAASNRPVVTPRPARTAVAPKAKAATAKAMRTPAPGLQLPTRAPPARTHFHLAPAATSIPEIARSNREQIAADIEAFRKAGGRIERLGPTQFFKPARAGNDE